jgi:hypothetical protein
VTVDPATVSRLSARLQDLPLELADAEADTLVADLRAAGLVLAAASVAAGQRQRAQILADAAADLMAGHAGRSK